MTTAPRRHPTHRPAPSHAWWAPARSTTGAQYTAWLVFIVVVMGAGNAFGGKLVNEFVVGGSDAQSAVNLLKERFAERAGDSTQIVFASDDGFE